jgi:hypothetical protein
MRAALSFLDWSTMVGHACLARTQVMRDGFVLCSIGAPGQMYMCGRTHVMRDGFLLAPLEHLGGLILKS